MSEAPTKIGPSTIEGEIRGGGMSVVAAVCVRNLTPSMRSYREDPRWDAFRERHGLPKLP